MKLIKAVRRIDVKRYFVASQYIRKHGSKSRYLPLLSRAVFIKKLSRAKRYAEKLKESQLDRIIKNEYEKRWKAYNNVEWYLGIASVSELGVWKGAGGLPVQWTRGSLKQTAEKVKAAMKRNSSLISKRARRAIPRILQTSADLIQKDKYLFPIVLPGGTQGRKGLQKMKGDIDDGCMRSIALAVKGCKKLKVYIGVQKKLTK